MDFIKNNARIIIIGLFVIALIVALSVATSNNEGDTEDTTSTETSDQVSDNQSENQENQQREVSPEINPALPQPTTDSEVVEEDSSLVIVAEEGDNQSVMARKIVAVYTARENSNLSPGQLLFMETTLAQEAGNNDVIPVGSKIEVDTTRLEELNAQAEELPQDKVALWETYL